MVMTNAEKQARYRERWKIGFRCMLCDMMTRSGDGIKFDVDSDLSVMLCWTCEAIAWKYKRLFIKEVI